MARIIPAISHIDHNLSDQVIEIIKDKIENYNQAKVMIMEIILEDGITAPCGLYGPRMGDSPIEEDEVYYENRGNRKGKSRMIARPWRHDNTVTVIAGPHEWDDDCGHHSECILYTAFGGPLAPKEPWDTKPGSDEEKESQKFWSQHALAPVK